MNRYGTQAMRHWQQTDPARYQQIPDPETFFTELGEQVESEIQTLANALAGPDPPGETYLEKVGRLNMARFNAESDILREMVLIPEPEEPEEPAPESWNVVQRAIQEVMDEENFAQDQEEDEETPETPPAG
jgi:hypothetical protein